MGKSQYRWILGLIFINAHSISISTGSAVFILDNASNHEILWAYYSPEQKPFLQHLNETKGPNEFYYLLTGDSQFWFPCTHDNLECLKETRCTFMQAGCSKPQGEFANEVQLTSLRALIKKMRYNGVAPKKLIMNGDLSDFGHEEELKRYKEQWPRMLEGISVYPGLGNHDYANNVDECTVNRCAHRSLKYFKDYVGKKLRRPLHVRSETEWFVYKKYYGSLAYSWDECVYIRDRFANPGTLIEPKAKCVHFIQLNNYPSYEREVKAVFTAEWHITQSFDWLREDLQRNRDKAIIVNLHDFDSYFSPENKVLLRSILSDYNVIGIFFAHIHSRSGLHPQKYWCLQGRPVPLLYSGSVPANRYSLIRLNPEDKRKIQAMYVLKAENRNTTSVKIINLPLTC